MFKFLSRGAVKFLLWWAVLAFVAAGLWPHLVGDGPFGVVVYVLVMGLFTGMLGGLWEIFEGVFSPGRKYSNRDT